MAFFSIKDIISIIKCNYTLIVIIGILCALVFGGYRGYSLAKEGLADDTQLKTAQEEYQKALDDYGQQKSGYDDIVHQLQSQLATANKSVEENPVMQLDPFTCGYETIAVSFPEVSKTNRELVRGWINTTPTERLFGKEDSLLEKYKTEIVYSKEKDAVPAELLVYVFGVDGIDTNQTANRVAKVIKDKAKSQDVAISSIVVSHYNQYCQALADLQFLERDDIRRLSEEVKQIKERVRILEVPSAPSLITKGTLMKSIAKYLVFGLICGLIFGILLVLFLIKQGQIIISRKHMDELFDLTCLGDLQNGAEQSAEIIKANLDVVVHNGEKLLVIAKERNALVDDLIKMLKQDNDQNVFYGENLDSDVEAIRAMEYSNVIICCVYFGKTTYDEIRQIITKAKKMNKQMAGYVIVG